MKEERDSERETPRAWRGGRKGREGKKSRGKGRGRGSRGR